MIEQLPDEVRRDLLTHARRVLEAAVAGRPRPAPPRACISAPASAFVTLRRRGELRGCIGDTSFTKPLEDVVAAMTEAAATSDPRFTPIDKTELEELTIEISRLTRFVPATVGEVEPGQHGVMVRKGKHRGLLLPQVATEFGCDGASFVALACQKAGLPPDAVDQADLEIEVFEAEVFSE